MTRRRRDEAVKEPSWLALNAGVNDPVTAPSARRPRVAVIDLDIDFVARMTSCLDLAGWEHCVLPGAVPVERLITMRLGALVIDLPLLGQHAWDYLTHVSSGLTLLPIVVCAGPSTAEQRVRGLQLGADDWMTKPCDPEEVIARIQAIARRQRRADTQPARTITAGEIDIHPRQFQVFVNSVPVDLTRREFELIELLATADGRVLKREAIYQRIWGYGMAPGDRSVDVYVRKLRTKLRHASPSWSYIHTHIGVGYRFAAQPTGDHTTQTERTGPSHNGPAEP